MLWPVAKLKEFFVCKQAITNISAYLADHASGHLGLVGIDAVGVRDLFGVEAFNLRNFEINLNIQNL